MLPRDTITFFQNYSGTPGVFNISNPPTTILGFQVHLFSDKLAKILCGDISIYEVSTKTRDSYVQSNYTCYDQLKVQTTTTDEVRVLVNYVPRDRILIPDPVSEYQNASTTNGFFNGDILINYFLFLIMVACVFGFILKMIIRKK